MSICDNDSILFHQACRQIINQERASMGIGTLSEKTVHAVLKAFYEPDPEHQESPVENFVADILRDGEIIEIQTRGFNKLRRKLDTFLKYYPVTIVYTSTPNIFTGSTRKPVRFLPKENLRKQAPFTMPFRSFIK